MTKSIKDIITDLELLILWLSVMDDDNANTAPPVSPAVLL
jgi:hypothetical protein